MRLGTSPAALEAFVRPRFDDGTFEEPLPLEDHFVERFLTGERPARAQLLLVGPRGSGLSTTLRWLAELAASKDRQPEGQAPRIPISIGELLFDPAPALERLRSGEGVLFLDMSITPLTPGNWRATHALMTNGVPGHPDSLEDLRQADMVVVATHDQTTLGQGQGCAWTYTLPHLERAHLAPWTSDDLLELLGSVDAYRERRADLFGALRTVRHSEEVLARPRTALWLVEAAMQIAEGEPLSLAMLYANVLDTLSPWAIEVLRRMTHDDLRLPLLRDVLLERIDDPQEATTLFACNAELAATIGKLSQLEGDALAKGVLEAFDRPLRVENVPLALPGLHDFLQAGGFLEQVSKGEVPTDVAQSWFPFLRELISPAQRATLASWLTAAGEELHGERVAATALLALGEPPALDARVFSRPLELAGAFLPRLDLPGAHLNKADLFEAVLSGARLEGAFMGKAKLAYATCIGTSFEGAHMTAATLSFAQLHNASLRGATLNRVDFTGAALPTADLEGAHLLRARFEESDLTHANLSRAHLDGAVLRECRLRGTNLRSANLQKALLDRLDLTEAKLDAYTLLAYVSLQSCNLSGMTLPGVLRQAQFYACDLTSTVFRGATLPSSGFKECRMHDVNFDGADLRDAVFKNVNFHAGSSRAGTLTGKQPMEGSMTGYYAEGTTDDAWASPESIRAASFRGADLRDARFIGSDLFRIDFREANLDPELREKAKKAGAILD